MGVDRVRILNVDCERTPVPVTRRIGFDAEFNAPHVFQVNCPYYSGVATCRLASLEDERGNGCLFWRPESVTDNERAF